MLKLIKQRHKNGCVPASIAMLAGLTYKQILKFFSPNKNWSKRGTKVSRAIEIIQKLGLKTKNRKICNLSKLKHNALLVIRWYNQDPKDASHAIVWDAETKLSWIHIHPKIDGEKNLLSGIIRNLY